jgi:hypothetical protein
MLQTPCTCKYRDASAYLLPKILKNNALSSLLTLQRESIAHRYKQEAISHNT